MRPLEQHQLAHSNWIDAALKRGLQKRDSAWTESLAVGSEHLVEGIKQVLGKKGRYRELREGGDVRMLREPPVLYNGVIGVLKL